MVGGTFVASGVAQFLTKGIGFLPEVPVCTLGTKIMTGEEVSTIGTIRCAANAL